MFKSNEIWGLLPKQIEPNVTNKKITQQLIIIIKDSWVKVPHRSWCLQGTQIDLYLVT